MTAHRFIKIFSATLIAAMIFVAALFCACSSDAWENPGDSLGGGGVASSTPVKSDDELSEEARKVAGEIETAVYTTEEDVKTNATHLTNKKISEPGAYYIDSGDDFSGQKINVASDGVTLCLLGASLSNDGKAIESEDYSLTLTLFGESEIESGDGKNAVDVAGDLTINGPGSAKITSEKNGVKANSIKVTEASLYVDAQKDALHAEIDYDDAEEEPEFSYEEGGFVYIDDATLDLAAGDDGIQADTFVFIAGSDTSIAIETNGGAPKTVTENSSDAADGKGIKAGTIDWGADDSEIESEDYLILIDDGSISINSCDDAVHSNGTIVINGGTFDIETGDDGIHADDLLQILGGEIDISKCYEGIESKKVEISGGDISVTSADDGINAANKNSTTSDMAADPDCHVIISGGLIYVDASGDGIDSNGTMLIDGGEVYVSGSTSGADAALDSNGGIIVNGGRLFACGALGMVETPSTSSEQYIVSYARSSAIAAGTMLYLLDSDDEILMEYEVPKSCQSVIISCPEMESGKSYAIYGGDTKLTSFTISSVITSVGSSTSIQNPGNMPSGATRPSGSGSSGGRR